MILKRAVRKLRREFRKRFPGRGKILPLAPEFHALVPKNATIERIATGFQFTEGPIWLKKDDALLFSDIPASKIYRLDTDRSVRVFRENSNHSNGMTLDAQGRLIVCEHETRRVTRTEPDGSISVLAEGFDQKALNNPNDVVMKSDGSIYFTDPSWSKEKESVPPAVYRIDPDSGGVRPVVLGLQKPNGLAFSPDELSLYVDDSGSRRLMMYNVHHDGTLRNERLFCDMNAEEAGSPDGMKLDQQGNIYCTGPGGIWVLTAEGTRLGTIVTPEQPANCAWGDRDGKGLYITARTSIYKIRTNIAGIAP